MTLQQQLSSLTYKVLTTAQPTVPIRIYWFLFSPNSVQPSYSTCSSSVATISLPPSTSSVKITNCSFWHSSIRLWNRLHAHFVNLILISLFHILLISHASWPFASVGLPLSLFIAPSLFHYTLKTHLFTTSTVGTQSQTLECIWISHVHWFVFSLCFSFWFVQ